MPVEIRGTTRSRRRRGAPVLISGSGARLERMSLDKGEYDERWLQDHIHHCPDLVPVGDIEPGFGELIPVACEVACGHGFIDNVFVTPTGDLVIVETKLWRNPEARRQVVAQTLDYVAALMTMSYEQFDTAIRTQRKDLTSLYQVVADHPDALDEPGFIDAVSANLRRGRMVAIALGDGIRQEAETLADLLSRHMTARFTFALVALNTYRNPVTDDIVAVPDTLLQTVMIERGVVRIEDGRITALPPSATTTTTTSPTSLTDQMFYGLLDDKYPGLSSKLQAFIASLEPLGVYAELGRALSLKVDVPDSNQPLNLGYIQKNAQLWTDNVIRTAPTDAAMRYLDAVAAIVGGSVKQDANPYATTNGSSAPRITELLQDGGETWRGAIAALVRDVRDD